MTCLKNLGKDKFEVNLKEKFKRINASL